MPALKNPLTIQIVPLPDGDFEAKSGSLSARGATVASAEQALLELYHARWQETHLPETTPLVEEDEVEEPEPEA